MQRGYVILAVAGLLALVLVTPVVAGPVKDLALKRAKKAKKIAKTARGTANDALASAQQANQSAQRANTRLDEQQIVSDTQSGRVTANNSIPDYESLGGPAVNVNVPQSGMIEVWAQADIRSDDGGAVALFEDGQPVPDISEEDFCGDDSVLFESFGGGPGDFDTYSSPPTANLTLGCTNTGAPSSVILQRPPGAHTYELRYSECVCGGAGGDFENRVLRIAARP